MIIIIIVIDITITIIVVNININIGIGGMQCRDVIFLCWIDWYLKGLSNSAKPAFDSHHFDNSTVKCYKPFFTAVRLT